MCVYTCRCVDNVRNIVTARHCNLYAYALAYTRTVLTRRTRWWMIANPIKCCAKWWYRALRGEFLKCLECGLSEASNIGLRVAVGGFKGQSSLEHCAWLITWKLGDIETRTVHGWLESMFWISTILFKQGGDLCNVTHAPSIMKFK